MQFQPVAIIRLLLPALLIGGVFLARGYFDVFGADARIILNNLPYLISLVALLLAYQFGRARMLMAAFGVGLFYWLVQGQLQVSLSDPAAAETYLGASLALPIAGLYLMLIPERGIWNLYGLVTGLAFIGVLFLGFQLASWLPGMSEGMALQLAARPVDGYVMSLGATWLSLAVFVLGLVILCLRNEEGSAALLACLVALYLGLSLLHLDNISVAMCAAGGACLVYGMLRSSHAMAYRDDLTGLLGRRALNERLQSLGRNYSIAMVDVDHFKRFNDKHGHDVGDEVLKLVASRLRQVGGGGTVYRYGGEEFSIVFPRRSADACLEPLERVRQEIAEYRMSLRDRGQRPAKSKEGSRRRGATRVGQSQVSVTISAGIAERSEAYPDPESVIQAADARLYKAKRGGRNRIAA